LAVLHGNQGDTTTLQWLLKTLQRRFGIKEAIFVFDGGMSNHLNLEQMEAEQKLDGWHVLHTNLSAEECYGKQTLGHYKKRGRKSG